MPKKAICSAKTYPKPLPTPTQLKQNRPASPNNNKNLIIFRQAFFVHYKYEKIAIYYIGVLLEYRVFQLNKKTKPVS